ncbi:MAG: putative Ig domain-containing protein, partial [Candidatus Wallbacteria bacterium]|nr:putative Ig domain-containing protein [Candidatus Wallbacteria bacterium]
MVGERNTLPGRALLAGGLLACGLALAGCGSGGQEALVGLLTRSARPSKEDLLQASRASLAQEGGAALAAAGFRQFLASFADDPRATDVRLDLAEALIAAGQPDRARETLGAVGPTSGVQAARGLYLRGLASLGDASAVHPHVQKGARSMLELHALIDQLATKSRPLPDYQVESMRQRLHIEDSVAQAEVDLSAAANLLATPRAAPELFATIAESEARAFFLLRNRARAVAIVTRALDSLSEARVAPERVKELLLLRAFFFAENRESDRAVLDLNRAVDGAVPAGAKPPQAAGAGGGATGSGPSLTENLQLVFRRATERLAAQTTLRARLARGTLLLTGEGSRGQAQLEALLPELDAAGEAALARAAQFALATRDQVADAAATISRVQALLPALASDPELEAAALITLAQYGFLDIALDQPPARPAADRLAVHQCTVGAIRRALALAKSGGFADPNLDARFLSQYPAPVPATAALPLGPVSFLPGVATSLELAGHAFVALPGRTADESFFAFGSLGNGPLEPPLGFTVGGGRLPSGLGLAASGSLSGTATETGVFSVDVDVSRAGPAEDSQRLELASVAIGLVDPDRRTYPMNPVVRAAAGSFRLTAAGGLPPYRLQIARVDTQLGSVAPRLTTAAISSDARNTFVVPIDNADTFSPSRIRVQLSDGAGHSVKEVLVLTRNAFPA